ncbi:MAG: hypothetical protein PHE18_05170 [Candidatus Omnitrophica bacterium]|nr:hypothetical protein [Candidatus Omnitrophota bacterium]MDD5553249.1 hypothetical protein [Candidatus Omnitrophota bacterium]
MKSLNKAVFLSLAAVFSLCCSADAATKKAEEKPQAAQEAPAKKEKMTGRTADIKEIFGQVTWIGKKYISVVYATDDEKGVEYEMLLPYEKDLGLEHKRNLSDIAQGDMVRVQYEEEVKRFDSGRQEVKRKAKVVTFVRAGVRRPATGPEEAPVERNPVMDSGFQP